MPSLTTSFNSSKLKLAHINIHSCRNRGWNISLSKRKCYWHPSLNETWFKSNFELGILNYTIARKDRLRRQGGGVAILVRNDIKFDIIDPCSTLNTDNEVITILLKNSQESIRISTIDIPPASNINTDLLEIIKKTADNIIIKEDLNAKPIDFNSTKTDKWGLELEKALYNADLFIADNSITTQRRQNKQMWHNRLYNLFSGYFQQNTKSYPKQWSFFWSFCYPFRFFN